MASAAAASSCARGTRRRPRAPPVLPNQINETHSPAAGAPSSVVALSKDALEDKKYSDSAGDVARGKYSRSDAIHLLRQGVKRNIPSKTYEHFCRLVKSGLCAPADAMELLKKEPQNITRVQVTT